MGMWFWGNRRGMRIGYTKSIGCLSLTICLLICLAFLIWLAV